MGWDVAVGWGAELPVGVRRLVGEEWSVAVLGLVAAWALAEAGWSAAAPPELAASWQ